jgi:hypothetical protein
MLPVTNVIQNLKILIILTIIRIMSGQEKFEKCKIVALIQWVG